VIYKRKQSFWPFGAKICFFGGMITKIGTTKEMNRTPENTELYGKKYGYGSILTDRRCSVSYVKRKYSFCLA
jgi:hypothetical protein